MANALLPLNARKRALSGSKALAIAKPRWGDFVSRKALDDLNKIKIPN
jgi:hypothetical protein